MIVAENSAPLFQCFAEQWLSIIQLALCLENGAESIREGQRVGMLFTQGNTSPLNRLAKILLRFHQVAACLEQDAQIVHDNERRRVRDAKYPALLLKHFA